MKVKIHKKVIAAALALTLVSGAVPLPPVADMASGFSITANAANVAEIEVSSWDDLLNNHSAASVTQENGVTTVTLNSNINATWSSNIIADQSLILDLNGYGIRQVSGASDGIFRLNGSAFTLKDSDPDRAVSYITLTNGRGTAVSTTRPSGSEGKDYITVKGGYLTGNQGSGVGLYSANGAASFVMEGGTICGNVTGNEGAGVYISDNCTFTMADGAIRNNNNNNKAAYAGGISFGNGSSISIINGVVENNTSIQASATANIGYNMGSEGNNAKFYLRSGRTVEYAVAPAAYIRALSAGESDHGKISFTGSLYSLNGTTIIQRVTP